MVEWIVVAGADNGGSVHASVGPTLSSRANGGAPLSDLVSCISLFKKTIVVTDLVNFSRLVITLTHHEIVAISITAHDYYDLLV
jgi:hypothetical protein